MRRMEEADREEAGREGLAARLEEAFCWFHSHPELSYEEYETTKQIRAFLEREGIEILPYSFETGLAAQIRGEIEGPVQALRCDIDALPVQEETGLSYRSQIPGRMHACGHDFHITAGLGCACLLQEQREKLCGTVKILFQPGEESSLGALKMLETDVMEDVECIWGFHADPTNAVKAVGIREGFVSAAVDRFIVRVRGVGCHGAHPNDGIDPVPAACAMVQAFQTMVTRNADPFHPTLISVTRIQAGNTWNVIPAEAELEGTVRTMNREDRELFEKRLREIAVYTAKAYQAEASVEWIPGPPAVENDGKMAGLGARVAAELGFDVREEEQSLGGDDFSFYEEKIPGCYIKIGTGVGQTIHQPGFRVDPAVLMPAAEYLAEVILERSRDGWYREGE